MFLIYNEGYKILSTKSPPNFSVEYIFEIGAAFRSGVFVLYCI